MVPLLARDAERLREAYGLRADAVHARGRRARLRRAGDDDAGAGGGRAGARDGCRCLAGGARLRARAPARRAARERLPWSRDDRAFALAAVLLVVVPVAPAARRHRGVRSLPAARGRRRRGRCCARRCALTGDRACSVRRLAAPARPPARLSRSGACLTLLHMSGVTYRYPGDARPALDDVDLVAGRGRDVVLAGLSGSGKSTLLRAACGLVPHFYGGEMAGQRARSAGATRATHGPARRRRRGGDGASRTPSRRS